MPFLHQCWYVACWSSELQAGAILARKIIGERLALFRDQGGKAVALQDRCAHRFAPLSKGRCEGDGIRCMYHGLKFAPSGQCMEIPGQPVIPDHLAVRRFAIEERGGWVWIWMAEPEHADIQLIPDVVALDDEHWAIRHGTLEYHADYQLINDNLLDFSHLSYVHSASFGAGTGWAETQPNVHTVERGVRIERWLEAQPRSNSRPDISARFIDHWSRYDYLVPGVLHSVAYSYPVGTARSLSFSEPFGMAEPLYGTITSQAVTPMEEGRCRYFFSRGLPHDQASEPVLERMMAVTQAAFEEDRVMIEAQQRVIDEAPPAERMFVTAADRALVLFRRMMAKLSRDEAEQTKLALP